jgi:hypothetical protein
VRRRAKIEIMPLELRWKASLSATCLHAALCQRAGLTAADSVLAAAVDGPAAALAGEIAEAGWPVDAVLGQLAGLAAEYENNLELATRALARLRIVGGSSVSRVAGAIADLEGALRRSQPRVAEELAVRGRPLREQWEARGPGMLAQVARLTEPSVVPTSAEAVLVSPYAGGHGVAYPSVNRVALEAVLVNPHPELPESLRLAWLLCQLNCDLPRYADAAGAARVHGAASLALIPPVLAAAEAVELARCDEATFAAALDAWRPPRPWPREAPRQLWSWWNAWLDGPTSWPVAVAALDRLRG